MLQKGDQQQITIGSICTTATVKQVETFQTNGASGAFVTFDVPGYGETQPFWYDEKTSYAQMRRSRSGMPKEYTYKRGKDFNWDYYRDDTNPQKILPMPLFPVTKNLDAPDGGYISIRLQRAAGKPYLLVVWRMK